MHHFKLQMETLDSQDSWLPAPPSLDTYWNVWQSLDFRYTFNPKMVNGIMIDLDREIKEHKRRIYSFTNWMSEVGGFAKAIQFMLAVVFPLVTIVDLNAFLITKLFKTSSTDNVYYDGR